MWTLETERLVTTVDQLDEAGLRQVMVAGTRYDGDDRPAAERLQGNGPDELDGNLMEVRIFKILDGDQHLYDVWAYMVDSGTIFAANTTDVVAEIIQFGLECTDPVLAAQLKPVLKGLVSS